jgi:hypothetical protein
VPDVELPLDEVQLERAIANKIVALLLTVPHVEHAYATEIFPEDDEEDEALTAVNDPVAGDKAKYTNFIEVSIPAVHEQEYTSDTNTQLTFVYPIIFTVGVVPKWAKADFEFTSSAQLFIATYMRARKLFKENRTLGFKHTVSGYLQQEHAGTVTNEQGEAESFSADWSLTVIVTGVKR